MALRPGIRILLRKTVYFLVFLLAMWWLFISSSILDEGAPDSDIADDNILFKDFKLNNPREGWELYADECLKNDTTRTTLFKIVKVIQTEKDGTVTTLTSKKGSINENHKRVDLQEDVVAHHLGGIRKIFTDRLLYSYKMKVGSSPGKVRIEETGSICTGNSMDFNAGSNTGKVVGDVRIVINPDAPMKTGPEPEAPVKTGIEAEVPVKDGRGQEAPARAEREDRASRAGSDGLSTVPKAFRATGGTDGGSDAARSAAGAATRAVGPFGPGEITGSGAGSGASALGGTVESTRADYDERRSRPMRGIGPRSWLLDENEDKINSGPAKTGDGSGGK